MDLPPDSSQSPALSQDARRPDRGAMVLGWAAVFVAALLLYALTASRGMQWQDSGEHIVRIMTHEARSDRGLALSHPLHHYLGRIAVASSTFEPAFAVTLVSALAGAVCVANVFGLLLSITRKPAAALFGCVSLAVAHVFWQLATLTETYTLCAALLSGECWCLVLYARDRRAGFLMGALLLNGLGIANHLLASLTTPVLLCVLVIELTRCRVRVREALAGAVLWILGTLPYSIMVAGAWSASGDFVATMRSALFGRAFADEVLNTSVNAQVLSIFVAFIVYSFPNALLPTAAYGMARAEDSGMPRMAKRALLAGLLLHAAFVLRYNISDQHTFLLPVFVFLAIFGGVGCAAVIKWPTRRSRRVALYLMAILLVFTPAVYAIGPGLLRRTGLIDGMIRHKPYRDDYAYLFCPWSVIETSADQLGRHAMKLTELNGIVVIEDNMAVFAVQYRAILDDRTDIEIVLPGKRERIAEVLAGDKPVVLVPEDARNPAIEPLTGHWQRDGDLYVLKR